MGKNHSQSSPLEQPLSLNRISTEYKRHVFDDIYVDASCVFGIFDVSDDICYDIFKDMPDDIWWYLNIADIFDNIFDRSLMIFDDVFDLFDLFDVFDDTFIAIIF